MGVLIPVVGLPFVASVLCACASTPVHHPARSVSVHGRPEASMQAEPSERSPARPALSTSRAGSSEEAHADENAAGTPMPAGGGSDTEPRSSRFVDLPVTGFESAVLWIPTRGTAQRPVLVATHGAGGNARWHCELWRERLPAAAFVLCPRGVRMIANRNVESGYYYPNHHEIEREVMAALEALWSAFPDAHRARVVYAGYSQGATMGALMLVEHADVFTRLVLVEGGTNEWNLGRAKQFRRNGGERILFACGLTHCHDGARRSAHRLAQAGVAVRVEYVPGAGHTPAGRVGERVTEAFDWLTEGDPLWRDSE